MELRHLRYFNAIASELHVTRAAERLGVAQPALTRQMRALEAELGVALFRRTGRNIALTEAGQVFLAECRGTLERAEGMVAATRKAGRGESGRVVVGYIETASYTALMADIIAACRHRWPEIELALVQDRTLGLVEALTHHTVDLALVRPPLAVQAGITLDVLAFENMMVAVHHRHRLAQRDMIDISELAGEAFISHGRQLGRAGLHDLIEQACQRAGFQRRMAQYAPQYASGINLVAAGLGVAIVPACLQRLHPDAVTYVPLRSDPPLISEIAMVSRGSERAPAVLKVLEVARGLAQKPAPRKRRTRRIA